VTAEGVTAAPPAVRSVLVLGPRAERHVHAVRAPGDPVISLHAIQAALGGDEPHLRHVALRALGAALEAAQHLREPVTVWLVHPTATPAQVAVYRARGFGVVLTGPNMRAAGPGEGPAAVVAKPARGGTDSLAPIAGGRQPAARSGQ
jgi:hypothetical protein